MNHQLAAAARCAWVTARIARTTSDPAIRLDAMASLAAIAQVSPNRLLRRTAVGALVSIAGPGWTEAILTMPDAERDGTPGDAA